MGFDASQVDLSKAVPPDRMQVLENHLRSYIIAELGSQAFFAKAAERVASDMDAYRTFADGALARRFQQAVLGVEAHRAWAKSAQSKLVKAVQESLPNGYLNQTHIENVIRTVDFSKFDFPADAVDWTQYAAPVPDIESSDGSTEDSGSVDDVDDAKRVRAPILTATGLAVVLNLPKAMGVTDPQEAAVVRVIFLVVLTAAMLHYVRSPRGDRDTD